MEPFGDMVDQALSNLNSNLNNPDAFSQQENDEVQEEEEKIEDKDDDYDNNDDG